MLDPKTIKSRIDEETSIRTSREICKVCYHVNPVGFQVPDSVWRDVLPEYLQENVICLTCFARLADECCIPWDQDIKLFPVSLATHLEIKCDIQAAREALEEPGERESYSDYRKEENDTQAAKEALEEFNDLEYYLNLWKQLKY